MIYDFGLISMLIKETVRSRQDSNLRGETPLDFKSNALTTRPRMLTVSVQIPYNAELIQDGLHWYRLRHPNINGLMV